MKESLSRFAYVVVLLVVASYAFVTLRGPKGLHALFEKQAQVQALEKSNAELAKEVERKREHIRRLGTDPAEQEREIRDRYKLVRPGEKVYITGDPAQK